MALLTQSLPYVAIFITALSSSIALCHDNVAKPNERSILGLNPIGATLLILLFLGLIASAILVNKEQDKAHDSKTAEQVAVPLQAKTAQVAAQRHDELVSYLKKTPCKDKQESDKRVEELKIEDKSVINASGWMYVGTFSDSKGSWLGAKLDIAATLPAPKTKYRTVTGAPLRVKVGPSEAIIGMVPAGATVEVTDIRHRTNAEVWVEISVPRAALKL